MTRWLLDVSNSYFNSQIPNTKMFIFTGNPRSPSFRKFFLITWTLKSKNACWDRHVFSKKGGKLSGRSFHLLHRRCAKKYETTHHFKPFRFRSHVNRQVFLHLLGPHRHKLSPKVFLFVGVGTHVFILKINPKRNSTVGNYSVWVGKEFVQQIFGHRSNEVWQLES